MKMSGMQFIPTIYPVTADQAVNFKILLSYPTADFHFMNFLMNLDYFLVVLILKRWYHRLCSLKYFHPPLSKWRGGYENSAKRDVQEIA